jgi:N-acyl-D-amino-acid deacylase
MKWILLFLFYPVAVFTQQPSCDLLITNGKIIDGTGNNWYYGSMAIKDGKIISIGRNINYAAARTIDASGLIVAPGFIDVHTHLEGDETRDPTAKSFIYDGVTTCVTGNCGSSNVNIGKYLHWVDSLKLSINVATLVGHNDVRKAVMGRANRDASAEEMLRMENIVDQAMKDGAVGLSFHWQK